MTEMHHGIASPPLTVTMVERFLPIVRSRQYMPPASLPRQPTRSLVTTAAVAARRTGHGGASARSYIRTVRCPLASARRVSMRRCAAQTASRAP